MSASASLGGHQSSRARPKKSVDDGYETSTTVVKACGMVERFHGRAALSVACMTYPGFYLPYLRTPSRCTSERVYLPIAMSHPYNSPSDA